MDTIWIDNVVRNDEEKEDVVDLGREVLVHRREVMDVLGFIFWANCLKAKVEGTMLGCPTTVVTVKDGPEGGVEECDVVVKYVFGLQNVPVGQNRWYIGQVRPLLGIKPPKKELKDVCGRPSGPLRCGGVRHECLRSRAQVALGVIGLPQFNYSVTRKMGKTLNTIATTKPECLQQFGGLIRLLTLESTNKLGLVSHSDQLKTGKLVRVFQTLLDQLNKATVQSVIAINEAKVPVVKVDQLPQVTMDVEPSTSTLPRRESRNSNFSVPFLGDSPVVTSPLLSLKQTFPTESFKKSSRVFASQPTPFTPNPSITSTKTGPKINPKLQFCAPQSGKNDQPKDKFVKKSPEKKGQVKFPSPENKNRNQFPENLETFSIQKSLSGVSKTSCYSSLAHGESVNDPKRFFNSKGNSGGRKMTEEPKLTKEISQPVVKSLTNNLNGKYFSKMSTEDSSKSPTKAAVVTKPPISSFQPSTASPPKVIDLQTAPLPQLRPHAHSAVLPTTIPESPFDHTTPKGPHGPIKIEMIVSKTSIHTTLESLSGKGISDLVDDLVTQADKLREPRHSLQQLIQDAVTQCHPSYRCDIGNYGSCVTGLITPFSDMDLCIKTQPRLLRADVNHFLAKLTTKLSEIPAILTVKHIETAAVPIIKLTASIGQSQLTPIDLSVETADEEEGQSTAFRTTQFICECIHAYPSFKPVVLFLKYALNLAGLNDTYKGGLNAYGLCVLYLAFLRTKRCQNSTNIGRLTRDFLRFLTQEFDYTCFGVYFGFGYE